MERYCDRCKRLLKDEYGVCDECRVLRYIEAHQDHIMSCSEFIAGKWGDIDQADFENAQAGIVQATNEINHLSNGSKPKGKLTAPIIKPPQAPIYSDPKRLELYRRCIANGIKDGIADASG